MPELSLCLIFLTAVMANTLYIHKQQNVRKLLIFYNENNTWSDYWSSMTHSRVNDDRLMVFKIELLEKGSSDKIRLIFNKYTWESQIGK